MEDAPTCPGSFYPWGDGLTAGPRSSLPLLMAPAQHHVIIHSFHIYGVPAVCQDGTSCWAHCTEQNTSLSPQGIYILVDEVGQSHTHTLQEVISLIQKDKMG